VKLNKKKVSFLISGKGSNLFEILVNNFKNKNFNTVSIISNNKISDEIKNFINDQNLKINIFEKITNLKSIYIKNSDVVFSVGYMKVINRKLINKHNIINLHPSLLPKYKGLMTQKRMLINNEKEFGFTIHKVSTELDAGDIICQKRKKITNFDEQKILRAHKELEHEFVFKELVNYLN
jgi:folate-dependent phosphoribosylglycinamide formyltransferase PurN